MSGPRETRRPGERNLALLVFAASSFVAGASLMLFFESAISRVAGVAGLFVFILAGVFLVAAPDFLEGDDRDDSFPSAPPG